MQTVIFDFDGTLVDSLEQSLRIANALAPQFGLRQVTESELQHLRELNPQEILRGLKIPLWKLPCFLHRLRQEMVVRDCALLGVPQIPQLLQDLSRRGVRLGVLSSNDRRVVERFLRDADLLPLFTFVEGGARIFGKSYRLRSLLRRYRIPRQQVFYVGDEVRDVVAARQAQVKSIAVTWGFNTLTALQQAQPHALIEQPQELLTILGLST